jgi:hypothetical protein
MSEFNFTIHGGKSIVNGKARWPDHITIIMSKRQAFRLLQDILYQLSDDGDLITYSTVGKLEEPGAAIPFG